MKLFVVNEDEPNVAKWSIWSEWSLVIAASREDALAMVPANNGKACELALDKPQVLVSMPEPAWGEDL